MANYLEANGILITNFKYPSDEGTYDSNFYFCSSSKKDIEQLAEVLNSYK